MARRYLGFDLNVRAELSRLRKAAHRLVRTPWARQRIPLIAEALLQRGRSPGRERYDRN